MKKILLLTLVFLSFFIQIDDIMSQNVAINSDGTAPDASAMLEIKSTAGGILIPRMTLVQRNLINVTGSPTGVMIYQTDNTPGFYYYDGTSWIMLAAVADADWTVSGVNQYSAVTGNVGIGVTNPTEKLQIGGTNAKIYMSSATSNMLFFVAAQGLAAPTMTTRSAGTKIVLYPSVTGATVDYGIGMLGNVLWHSVPAMNDAYRHRFYGGTTNVGSISGSGIIRNRSQIELTELGSGDRNSYIDFHARNGSDFDFRLIRTPGTHGGIHFQNAGAGG